MADLSREEFLKLKEDATRRMRSLYGSNPMPPCPDFVALGGEKTQDPPNATPPTAENKPLCDGTCRKKAVSPRTDDLLSALNLKKLMSNPDSILIIGLILLLLSDNADEKLILALVFIML